MLGAEPNAYLASHRMLFAAGALQAALSLPSNEAVRSAVMAGPFAMGRVGTGGRAASASRLACQGKFSIGGAHLPDAQESGIRNQERFQNKASVALEQLIKASSASLGEQVLAGAAPGIA